MGTTISSMEVPTRPTRASGGAASLLRDAAATATKPSDPFTPQKQPWEAVGTGELLVGGGVVLTGAALLWGSDLVDLLRGAPRYKSLGLAAAGVVAAGYAGYHLATRN